MQIREFPCSWHQFPPSSRSDSTTVHAQQLKDQHGHITINRFPHSIQISLVFPLCPRTDPEQHITVHHHIFLASSGPWQFLRLSLTLKTLTVLRTELRNVPQSAFVLCFSEKAEKTTDFKMFDCKISNRTKILALISLFTQQKNILLCKEENYSLNPDCR